jgi:glycosyltransferase involved in cell wall biosynthesis
MNITGVVITKNEEKNIGGCLKSLEWCDQLIVVDSFSDDNTVEIAKSMNALVFQKEFLGYGSQKQFAIEQSVNDWIIMIDADERVTLELKNEILESLVDPKKDSVTAYQIPMSEFMFGKYVRHGGWYGYYRCSLFRKSATSIQGSVHEQIKTSGAQLKMRNFILHFSHFTVEHFIFKLNKYTTIEAKARYEEGDRSSVLKVTTLPIIVFLYKYLYQRGFLDGLHGYALAAMMSIYHFVREVKIMIIDYNCKHSQLTKDIGIEYDVFPRVID